MVLLRLRPYKQERVKGVRMQRLHDHATDSKYHLPIARLKVVALAYE